MRSYFISYLGVLSLWVFRLLYRYHIHYVNCDSDSINASVKQIKIMCLLNHTTLWEALHTGALPSQAFYHLLPRVVLPVAQETVVNKGFAVRFMQFFVGERAKSVSRKRDDTWGNFLGSGSRDTVWWLCPEGRMKRPSGLDKHGKAMDCRGGIADFTSIYG